MTEADWIKAGLSGLITALGVVLSLLANSYVNWWREKRAYQGLLGAVVSEAESNQVILQGSFQQFYLNGFVFREFSTAVVARCVGDQLFVKYVKPTYLQALYKYLRAISLANAYRGKSEYFQLEMDPNKAEDLLCTLREVWGQNLKECEVILQNLLRKKDR
jgi:hypothetical protein